MNIKHSSALLLLSALFSTWLYFESEIKLDQTLTSREWQSTTRNYISKDFQDENQYPIALFDHIDVLSNVKYLPNGTYLRESRITMQERESNNQTLMSISEKGKWELSDNYLLVSPQDFKETSSSGNTELSEEQREIIKALFVMDAEQSRRVDIINAKTILLSNLSHGSRLLSSN